MIPNTTVPGRRSRQRQAAQTLLRGAGATRRRRYAAQALHAGGATRRRRYAAQALRGAGATRRRRDATLHAMLRAMLSDRLRYASYALRATFMF